MPSPISLSHLDVDTQGLAADETSTEAIETDKAAARLAANGSAGSGESSRGREDGRRRVAVEADEAEDVGTAALRGIGETSASIIALTLLELGGGSDGRDGGEDEDVEELHGESWLVEDA